MSGTLGDPWAFVCQIPIFGLLAETLTEILLVLEARVPLLGCARKRSWLSGGAREWGETRPEREQETAFRPGSRSVRLCDPGPLSDLPVVSFPVCKMKRLPFVTSSPAELQVLWTHRGEAIRTSVAAPSRCFTCRRNIEHRAFGKSLHGTHCTPGTVLGALCSDSGHPHPHSVTSGTASVST